MYKIIKPVKTVSSKSETEIDEDIILSNIINGMREDKIVDLHSCVVYLDEECGIKTNGNKVDGTFKQLTKELNDFSKMADSLAANGLSISEIVKSLTKVDTNFSINDLQQMKVEVYGSVKNWQSAMTDKDMI